MNAAAAQLALAELALAARTAGDLTLVPPMPLDASATRGGLPTGASAQATGSVATGRAPRILIVDDEARNRRLLEAMLQPEGYRTTCVASGDEAFTSIEEQPPDLVLLDLMMPGMDGYEVATRMKTNPVTSNIPIIMVSAHDDRSARLRGLDAGAEDFLTKPVDRAELWLRIRNLLRLKQLTDLLQRQSAALEQQVEARTADLHQLAHYDALTGLPNRTLFYETLGRTVGLAKDRGWMVAVLFVDVDHFKEVNDTMGHATGDELLRQFGERLVGCVRIRDTVGRLGGDEFAACLLIENSERGAAVVAANIRDVLAAPFRLHGREVTVTASIGIALHPSDASDADTLLRFADTAMYRAKQAGRDTFRFNTAEMNAELLARRELETALRSAIENEEFVLHYQPKVELSTGRVVGAEALLRWDRPGHGLIAPSTFIPTLEDTGLIVSVGRWVIREACAQIAAWASSSIRPVQVSVNVSGRQFLQGDLESDVAGALAASGVDASLLEVELTESSLMANSDRTVETLETLTERGVRISVDDFGTGYSSLAYLRRFPIHKLKIDIAFIRDVTTNPDDAAIVRTIIRMARSLKLDVIAEGVETSGQLSFLQRHGCHQMQGFLFSRPLPASEMAELLRLDRRLPPVDRPTRPGRVVRRRHGSGLRGRTGSA